MSTPARTYRYPTDSTEEEWAFAAPYLTLLPLDASQRRHDLRAVFDALRWLMRAGAPWCLLPGDFPPWHAVYDQAQRWIAAGVFEAMVHDLRAVLRHAQGRPPDPSAVVLDARTLQSTPESGARAGYDGAKRRKGSKDAAMDTLGHLLALHVTPANADDRAEVGRLAEPSRPPRPTVSRSATWIRATRVKGRPKPRKRTASRSKSSSCPKPRD